MCRFLVHLLVSSKTHSDATEQELCLQCLIHSFGSCFILFGLPLRIFVCLRSCAETEKEKFPSSASCRQWWNFNVSGDTATDLKNVFFLFLLFFCNGKVTKKQQSNVMITRILRGFRSRRGTWLRILQGA